MMSPGTYIAKRRRAAGLSIDDVAARIITAPRLGEIDRRAWIERIEADVAAISPDVQQALLHVFTFSTAVLRRLIDLRSYGEVLGDPPWICRACGCSERDACIDAATGTACAWLADDLCSACATPAPKEISHAA